MVQGIPWKLPLDGICSIARLPEGKVDHNLLWEFEYTKRSLNLLVLSSSCRHRRGLVHISALDARGEYGIAMPQGPINFETVEDHFESWPVQELESYLGEFPTLQVGLSCDVLQWDHFGSWQQKTTATQGSDRASMLGYSVTAPKKV